jgi:hypothetical protein
MIDDASMCVSLVPVLYCTFFLRMSTREDPAVVQTEMNLYYMSSVFSFFSGSDHRQDVWNN